MRCSHPVAVPMGLARSAVRAGNACGATSAANCTLPGLAYMYKVTPDLEVSLHADRGTWQELVLLICTRLHIRSLWLLTQP